MQNSTIIEYLDSKDTTGKMQIKIPTRYEQLAAYTDNRVELILPVREIGHNGFKLLSYQAALAQCNKKEVDYVIRDRLSGEDVFNDVKDCKVILRTLYSASIVDAFSNTLLLPMSNNKILGMNSTGYHAFRRDNVRKIALIEQSRSLGNEYFLYNNLKIPDAFNEHLKKLLLTRTAIDAGNADTPVLLQIFPKGSDEVIKIIAACKANYVRCDIKPLIVTDRHYAIIGKGNWGRHLSCIERELYYGDKECIYSFGAY